jgi:hypothetical protein
VPPEFRLYYAALAEWGKDMAGPLPVPPQDPVAPYRLAWKSERKIPISLRLETWQLRLAREMARQHQLPYQRLLRLLIEDGLRRALAEGQAVGDGPVSGEGDEDGGDGCH